MGRQERKEEEVAGPKGFDALNRSLRLETMPYIKRIPYRKRWIYRDPAKEREITQRNRDIVESHLKPAMHVRAASLVLAAKKMGVCTLCRRKLLGSNAYRGIVCTRHDMALKAGVHNARQAMRNHPELNWKRILGEAALCRKCE